MLDQASLNQVALVVFTGVASGFMSAIITLAGIRVEVEWIKRTLAQHENELATLRRAHQ